MCCKTFSALNMILSFSGFAFVIRSVRYNRIAMPGEADTITERRNEVPTFINAEEK
jgi:hypothetical protein